MHAGAVPPTYYTVNSLYHATGPRSSFLSTKEKLTKIDKGRNDVKLTWAGAVALSAAGHCTNAASISGERDDAPIRCGVTAGELGIGEDTLQFLQLEGPLFRH